LSSAISIMFLLALTVGVYVFHREVGEGLVWLGERMGGARSEGTSRASRNATDPSQPSAPPPAPATGANLPQSGLASGEHAIQEPPSEPPAAPAAGSDLPQSGLASGEHAIQESPSAGSTLPSAAGSQPSRSLPPSNSPAGSSANSREAGQSEYLQAEQLLRANSGVGTGEAAQLLWISVEKGNPYAEIALADLYWHGRGVPKNCDQTRILLAAAARKGNPEARRRLEQFQQEGCE